MQAELKLLIINGYEIPYDKVLKKGYSVTPNKVWSKKSGRSANGTFIGDIVAIKHTVVVKFDTIPQSVVTRLEDALNEKAFIPVKFNNPKGVILERKFYSADPTYTAKSFHHGCLWYEDVTVELIEQ